MTTFLHALASATLVAAALAQTPPCAALNDQTNNVGTSITSYGFAGPNTNAWQFVPTTALVVQGLQIFTGNTGVNGFMTLELWSEDPATQLPLARLGGGTWRIAGGLGNAWQGANLDAQVVLLPSTPYWIVWIDPGFSTMPTDPAGAPLPTARRSGTAWTAGAAGSPLKCRLFCGLLDAAGVAPIGAACLGSSGQVGTVFTNQAPAVGNAAFALDGSGFPAGAPAFLALGLNPNFTSVPLPGFPTGCLQHTDVLTTSTGTTGTGNVRAAAAAGHVPFALAIPAQPALVGLTVGAQLGAVDTGAAAPVPVVVSNGLRFTLF